MIVTIHEDSVIISITADCVLEYEEEIRGGVLNHHFALEPSALYSLIDKLGDCLEN